jgi:hypothetical protein
LLPDPAETALLVSRFVQRLNESYSADASGSKWRRSVVAWT